MKATGLFTTLARILPTPYQRKQKHQIQTVQEQVVYKMPVPMGKRVRISLRDRILAVGTTGSGKTTAVKELVDRIRKRYPWIRLYILDTKKEPIDDNLASYGLTLHTLEAPDTIKEAGGVQVWQPPINDVQQMDIWFDRILKARKPCIVWVNEVRYIIDDRTHKYPMHYQIMLSMGRGFSMCVISESQRIAYIPADVLGMATHILRFRLQNDFDRRRIDDELGVPRKDRKEPIDDHGFYYKRMGGMGNVFYYKDWQEMLGVS